MTASLAGGTTLVLGGTRSGKSIFAENLLSSSDNGRIYIATAHAYDDEMSERIAIHRDRRRGAWETVEEPLALVDAIRGAAHPGRAILVDCLTHWLTNLMMAEASIEREVASLVQLIHGLKVPLVLVSNETNLGIIPENAMARRFVDFSGSMNQSIATAAGTVYFVTAGLPMQMK